MDDPQKASDAHSEAQRTALANWAMETLRIDFRTALALCAAVEVRR